MRRTDAARTMRLLTIAGVATLCAPLTAQPAAPIASAAVDSDGSADDPDQQIRCRRMPVTGSLVRRERICRTVAEWRRLSDAGNDVARQQAENGLICSGGPCRGFEPQE